MLRRCLRRGAPPTHRLNPETDCSWQHPHRARHDPGGRGVRPRVGSRGASPSRSPEVSGSVPSERGAPLRRRSLPSGSGNRGAAGLTCEPPLPDVPPQQVPGFSGGVPQLFAQRPPELRLGRAALVAHPRRLRMPPRAAPLSAGGGSPHRQRAAAAAATATRGRGPRHRRSGRAAPLT